MLAIKSSEKNFLRCFCFFRRKLAGTLGWVSLKYLISLKKTSVALAATEQIKKIPVRWKRRENERALKEMCYVK